MIKPLDRAGTWRTYSMAEGLPGCALNTLLRIAKAISGSPPGAASGFTMPTVSAFSIYSWEQQIYRAEYGPARAQGGYTAPGRVFQGSHVGAYRQAN